MAKIKLSCKEIVDDALIEMAFDNPFLINMVSRIGIHVINSEIPALAYTDGTGVFINARLVDENNAKGFETNTETGEKVDIHVDKAIMRFIIAHELFHLITLTFSRGKEVGLFRESSADMHRLWNYATDYEINSLLHHDRNEKGINTVGRKPDFCLYEEKYKNMTAEEIFTNLKQNMSQTRMSGASGDEDEIDSNNAGNNGSSSSGNTSSKEVVSNGRADDDGVAKVKGLSFGLDKDVEINDDILIDEIKTKIADAIASSKSNGHDMNAEAMSRYFKIVNKPVPFNWKAELTKYLKNIMAGNFTWHKPSRAGIAAGLVLPSTTKISTLKCMIAIDTSGSIGKNAFDRIMLHIHSILLQAKRFEVEVISVGSRVYPESSKIYTPSNFKSFVEYTPHSDGGNDLKKLFEYVNTTYKTNLPDLLIVVSDFYDEIDGNKVDVKYRGNCLLAAINRPDRDVVKPTGIKGKVIYIEKEAI